jgi:hypothetical protein
VVQVVVVSAGEEGANVEAHLAGALERPHGQAPFLNPRQAKELRGRPESKDQVVKRKLMLLTAFAVRKRYRPTT